MTSAPGFCTACQLDNPHPSIGLFTDKDGRYLGAMPTCRQCGKPVGGPVDGTEPAKEQQRQQEALAVAASSSKARQLSLPSMPLPALPEAPRAQATMTPRGLIKQAKARVKELNRFLAECKKLELERDELKRLIAASKTAAAKRTPQLSRVRTIAS